MTATTEPRGGFDYGWIPGENGWSPNMNANLLRLSRFGFHASVLSMTTTAPPGSPTSGAGYIIPAGATGAWAGKTGQVAVWDGSAWAYAVPRDGWTIHVVNVGLVVYEDGAWSQSNLATASGVGAEPYAGVPAQTSFWRSTAAGMRAWVQLVAADITDLATTLAGYLTKADPTFTGALKQGAATRLSSSGGADFSSLRVSNLSSAFNGVLVSDYVGIVGVRGATDFRDNYIQAADANHHHDTQYAPLAGAEILIHSDFGRSATADVWQSAFTNNAASGLQLSANSTATGTEITIEQVLTIPADGAASVYQVYIGPQLTGDQAPSGATYVDVIDPEVEYGTGTLRIKIELIGSGSSITGYVTSTFSTTLSGAPFVRTGAITVDGTIANSIDVRFNPDSTTTYVIRRNRVFRRNP